MRGPPRIFYVGHVATDELNRRFDQQHYVGAAARKVVGVCRALRAGKFAAVIVSATYNAAKTHRTFSEVTQTSGVPYVRVWSAGRAGLRRAIAAFSFLCFAIT